ncbi:pterin-4a-carbinolamine dehydratase [Candidatus Nitrososphaera evergladensis SR1]|uniref:4a-hydroxytetrahydrobiopterin dehydratase n=1 Tax=Candidatus Nitrososphaera evergladensis SR1 TaxID=1459636 RepID=A0A075MV32_9ARCH|nr:4a-hydroxytetrahydrobiopterin dehydratase [Candidatus Nitrososphaera evergladensis]AIF85018.1 pterin-4a-carbinolamine dehydratase [Candidatus Nitrososphaera evergladensis SR1]
MTRNIFPRKRNDDNHDDKGMNTPAAKRQGTLRLVLAIAAASMLAMFAYTGATLSQAQPQQQTAEARTLLSKVLLTKTMASSQDPAPGHETHQSAVFLPPLGEDVIYSGTLTWAASDLVELFTYHHYDGPVDGNLPPLYTEQSNNKTYASPLFFTPPDSAADHGSMNVAANAIGFHSLKGTAFTVTATFDGWTKKVALEKFSPGNATGYLATASNDKTKSSASLIPETAVNPKDMNYTILSESQIKEELTNNTELDGWRQVADNGSGKLHKTFQFKNFVQAFQFMYRVGLEAEKMNHHPDWTNNYNTVSAYLYTWSAGNKITDYDIKLAGIMKRSRRPWGDQHDCCRNWQRYYYCNSSKGGHDVWLSPRQGGLPFLHGTERRHDHRAGAA